MEDTSLNTPLNLYILEYKAARDETRATTDQFYKMTQFGGTAVLAFAGLAFGFWSTHPIAAAASFGALLPILSFFFIEILLGNIAKVARSAEYCRLVEAAIRKISEAGKGGEVRVAPRFGWETWIQGEAPDENRQIVWPYACALSFFSIVSVLCVGIFEFYLRATWCRGTLWGCVHEGHLIAVLVFCPGILELVKLWAWLTQASNIARPLRGSLMGAVTSPAITNRVRKRLSSLRQFTGLAGASPSGIIVAIAEFAIAFWALRAAGLTILLFVVGAGTIATRLGRDEKLSIEGQTKKRTWRNALANAGVATSLAIALSFVHASLNRNCLILGFVSSLAAALSDTISHEIGVLYGTRPRSITTLKRVARGENGAVSMTGSLAGLLASSVVSGIAYAFGVLPARLAVVAALAGFAGNLVDSLLGATLEGRGVLNNDLVNLACTASSMLLAVGYCFYF